MKLRNPKIGKIISIVSAAFLALTGLALIICAAHLFFTGGDRPYSRERVGEYLSYLIIPAAITAVSVIVGLVYDVITKEKQDDGFKRSEGEMLEGYAKRFELEELDEKVRDGVVFERNTRLGVKIFFYTISILFAIFALAALLYADFTVENLSGDVLGAFAVVLPLVTASFAATIPCYYLSEASAKRERALLLDAVKSGYKPAPPKGEPTSQKELNRTKITRYVVLGIAVLFIVLGIFNGGMADVLEKAVKICTECIGLG